MVLSDIQHSLPSGLDPSQPLTSDSVFESALKELIFFREQDVVLENLN